MTAIAATATVVAVIVVIATDTGIVIAAIAVIATVVIAAIVIAAVVAVIALVHAHAIGTVALQRKEQHAHCKPKPNKPLYCHNKGIVDSCARTTLAAPCARPAFLLPPLASAG